MGLVRLWSMPQGKDKAEVEDIEFSVMLPNINLLFLFCSVLILLDGSFMCMLFHVHALSCACRASGRSLRPS